MELFNTKESPSGSKPKEKQSSVKLSSTKELRNDTKGKKEPAVKISGATSSPSKFSFFTRFNSSTNVLEKCDTLKGSDEVEIKTIKRLKNQVLAPKRDLIEKSEAYKARMEKIQTSKLTKDSRQASMTSITSILFDTSNQYPKDLLEQLNTELWGSQRGTSSPGTKSDPAKISLIENDFLQKKSTAQTPASDARRCVRMNTSPALNVSRNTDSSSPKAKVELRIPIKGINFTKDVLCSSEAFEQIVSHATRSCVYATDAEEINELHRKIDKSNKKSPPGFYKHSESSSSTPHFVSFHKKSSRSEAITNQREKFELHLPEKIRNRQLLSSPPGLSPSSTIIDSPNQITSINSIKTTSDDDLAVISGPKLTSNVNFITTSNYADVAATLTVTQQTITKKTIFTKIDETSNVPESNDQQELPRSTRFEVASKGSATLSVEGHRAAAGNSSAPPVSAGATLRPIQDYSDDESLSNYHTPAGSPPQGELAHVHGTKEDDAPGPNYYPGCDPKIWLRTCTHTTSSPLQGVLTGEVPKWLRGSLVRNGPGRMRVGNDTYNHLFDGSALLHRFSFKDGEVTYQNRFLESQSYKRDTEAQRIVVRYFATKDHLDPCRTIMQNISSKFSMSDQFTDNCQISVYPYGDGLYALTETPYMYRIDPRTLDTKEKVDLTKHLAIMNHTAHPHVTPTAVYNIGQGVGLRGPRYNICEYPSSNDKGEKVDPFQAARIVATVPCRWRMSPCYMHSFALTDNYFVIIEQPLVVAMTKVVKAVIQNGPMVDALEWWDKKTHIHLVRRDTGATAPITYITDSFFFLHTINAYEDDGHVVLDVSSYKDASMLNCMFVEALQNASYDPSFSRMFRGRPKRWVLPINPPGRRKTGNITTSIFRRNKKQPSAKNILQRNSSEIDSTSEKNKTKGSILKKGQYNETSMDDTVSCRNFTSENCEIAHNQKNKIESFFVKVNKYESTNIRVSVTDVDAKFNKCRSAPEVGHFQLDNFSELSNGLFDENHFEDDTDGICFGGRSDVENEDDATSSYEESLESTVKITEKPHLENGWSTNKAIETSENFKITCQPAKNPSVPDTKYSLNQSKENTEDTLRSVINEREKSSKNNITIKASFTGHSPKCTHTCYEEPSRSKEALELKKEKENGDSQSVLFSTIGQEENLTTLSYATSRSCWRGKHVFVEPEVLVDIGCEVPRINYENYNGKFYHYFYAICSDVDRESPGSLVKVDVVNKTFEEWNELNVYPSEPVFVPRPNRQSEDDGVLLSSVIRDKDKANEIFLLILDAKSFSEIGRVTYTTKCPTPKCLHGWFVQDTEEEDARN